MGSGKAVIYALFLALGVWLMLSGYSANSGGDVIPGFSMMSAQSLFAPTAGGDAFVQSGAFVVFLIIILSVLGGGRRKY